LGMAARKCIVENFAWETISPQAGELLAARSRYAKQPLPMFSVLVAPEADDTDLEQVIGWLSRQCERDFEVIVVDRSRNSWSGTGKHYGFPLTYLHRPHLGIGEAINAGAFVAMGHFLIISRFDELSDESWLLHIHDALTGHGGNAGVVAWIPPASSEVGVCFPSMAVRAEALRLVGGFDSEIRIWDLARQDTLAARLRRIGVVERSSLFNGSSMRPGQEEKSVLLLTTQGHKCGVGEYTNSMVDALERKGFKCHVLTCQTESHGIPVDTYQRAMYVGWYYDDLEYSKSRIYKETEQFMREVDPSLVVIQYHPAFFGAGELERFADACLERNTPVVIDDHRFRPEDASSLKGLVGRGASVFLHRQGECDRARGLDLDTVLSPIGIENLLPLEPKSIVKRDWRMAPPRLVTSGFLRAHKGVRTLIKAMPRILGAFPAAVLRVQCAEYPSADSVEELERCHSLIVELGLNSQVQLDTAFYEKSEVFALIRDADLALFAYDESEEGGSAAAGDCFSVGLPLMVSTARIFDDIRSYAITVKGGSEAWAREIIHLLESPDAYSRLSSSARDFVFDNNWDKAVDRFIRFIH
jgi:glycosyltransferase involved in cell wall biosynthesis